MITKKKIESLFEKTSKGKLFMSVKAYAKTRIAFGILFWIINNFECWKEDPTLNPHAMATFSAYKTKHHIILDIFLLNVSLITT